MPRWTESDLLRFQARAVGCEPGLRPALEGKGAELERTFRSQPLAEEAPQEAGSGKLWIRVESVRSRLLDEDNLCPKHFIDCLRYAGVIRDDTEKDVRIETTQRKPKKGEEEHTLIRIWRI